MKKAIWQFVNLALTVVVFHCLGFAQQASMSTAPAKTPPKEYHGWKDAIFVRNGKAEVVIVPSLGRVMQFRFLDGKENNGVFWENGALYGKALDAKSSEWGNFGGDKSWPSPQSDWPKMTQRNWPPPSVFDSVPVTAIQMSDYPSTVVLKSEVDPNYGIRTHRRIKLDHSRAVLTIETTYEKVSGGPVKVGVWVITQTKEPERVFINRPEHSIFKDGYAHMDGAPPYDYKEYPGWISMRRDPKNQTKIDNDGSTMVWVGKDYTLKVESPRFTELDGNSNFPDSGTSTQVYTNPDPLPYVELETLGPLSTMMVGDKISRTNVYTLEKRGEKNAEKEAQRMMGKR